LLFCAHRAHRRMHTNIIIAQGGIRAMKYPGAMQFDSLAGTITNLVNQQTVENAAKKGKEDL
jgi:hypothetical protein